MLNVVGVTVVTNTNLIIMRMNSNDTSDAGRGMIWNIDHDKKESWLTLNYLRFEIT
jgi:hypothetical protein